MLATDCDFGPDSALYISDWVNGWTGVGSGRIHRVGATNAAAKASAEATRTLLAEIPTKPASELPSLLADADMRVRLAAEQRLVAAGLVSAPVLGEVASDAGQPLVARLHAIWGLGQLAESEPGLFDRLPSLTQDKDAEIRAQAARTLGRAAGQDETRRSALGKSLIPLLADASPRVRSLAAIAVGKLQTQEALPGLLALARENADHDPVLRHAAAVGLAGSQSAEALVAAGKHPGPSERLAIVVALGRQKSPQAAAFLADPADRVRLEAARVIWDAMIPEAYPALAATIARAPKREPLVRRALAANLMLGTADNLHAVVDFGLRNEVAPELRDLAWETVRGWASPSSRDPVHGGWRPCDARQPEVVTATLRAELPKILEAAELWAPALVVAAEMGLAEAYPHLVTTLAKDSLTPAVAARALGALSSAPDSLVNQAIGAAVKSAEPTVRIAARQLLAKRFPAQAAAQLGEVVSAGTLSEQQAAITSLAGLDLPASQTVIGELLGRVEAGSCPPAIMLDVLEAAAKSSDQAIVKRQKAYSDRIAAAAPLAQYAACLEGGDAASGKRIFEENSTLSCRRCHSRTSGEQLVGPNLSDVGTRQARNQILESIVTPNAKIVEGFQTTTMLLDTGTTVSGILRSKDGKHAVLVDKDGNEIVVDLDTVEEKLQGQSAMPEGLAKQMTPRDLRDLVEFLSTLHTPPEADRPAPPLVGGHGGESTETNAGE